MASYRSTTFIPPLARQAMELATRLAFEWSCSIEVGRLLQVLAGQVRGGVIGEIGTGCGVSAAWMAGVLAPGVSFITIELDGERADAARALFTGYPRVRVLHGDWHDILAYGPFDLLFIDAGAAKAAPNEATGGASAAEAILGALRPGGLIVLDDLTPEDQWPPEWRGRPDPLRAFWLNDARLAATEIYVTPASNVILATRLV